jgi:hypothetical protein
MVSVNQIILYGGTEKTREEIYQTLKQYGYHWNSQQGYWQLEVPKWINKLVGDSWYHHEITR